MYNDHYALAFNPFDKQQLPEKDCFCSRYFNEMTSRLDYLKDTRGDRAVHRQPGHGEDIRPALLRGIPQSKPLPHGVYLSFYGQRR